MTRPADMGPMHDVVQPSRDDTLKLPRLHVADHPLVTALATRLRDSRTGGPAFTHTIEEITRFLLWQALADVVTPSVEVTGYDGRRVTGRGLPTGVAALVLLRAGLSMAPAVTALIPGTPIYHVGVRRDEATLQPSVYATNLPARADAIRHLLILDPMLATGGSALAALRRARTVFAGPVTFIGIIGAPLGVTRLDHHDQAVTIHLAALDDGLDTRGYIVPGLGDAGDRAFGAQA